VNRLPVHVAAVHGNMGAVDAAAVVAELSRVFPSRDWMALRALYHPSALIMTVTGGPSPLTADETVAELERASQDIVYLVTGSDPRALDEHAVVVTGRMRWRMPNGGFHDAGYVWLITVRDDLVYRQAVYANTEEAAAAYRALGVELGMGPGLADLPDPPAAGEPEA
jgi:hypothetical protein